MIELKDLFGESMRRDLLILLKATGKKSASMINIKTVALAHSEYNPKHYSLRQNMENSLVSFQHNSKDSFESGIKRIGKAQSHAVYINGMTTHENMARYQQLYLEELLGCDIELLYNYSGGLLVDLIECVQDREGTQRSVASIALSKIFLNKLEQEGKIDIFAHSQGGILATAALTMIRDQIESHPHWVVHYITFGSGFKRSNLTPRIMSEHYGNLGDPICYLGLLPNAGEVSGKTYTRNEKGHLLVPDYLYPIKAGKFTKDSWFYQQIN
jgi:hypothetical protein